MITFPVIITSWGSRVKSEVAMVRGRPHADCSAQARGARVSLPRGVQLHEIDQRLEAQRHLRLFVGRCSGGYAERRTERDGRDGLIFPLSDYEAAGGCAGCGAPCPPSRRSSIRRLNAQPDERGWSCRRTSAGASFGAPRPCATRTNGRSRCRRSRWHRGNGDGCLPTSGILIAWRTAADHRGKKDGDEVPRDSRQG